MDPAGPTTHETLLARLTDGGDPGAWRDFCRRYELLIRGFAQQQGLQPADCDDVVQEVFLSLTRSLPGFRYDRGRGRFRSYLKSVVLHAVFRGFRQKRRQTALSEEETARLADDPATDESWEVEWRQHHLRLALAVLAAEFSAKDVELFGAYVVKGLPADEAAHRLGASVDQVYQAKSRMLRRLSEIVERQIGEEG